MNLVFYILSYAAALLGIAIVAAYVFFTRKFGFWEKKSVKCLKPTPFVGNMGDSAFMRKPIGLVAKDIYDKHREEPYIGIYAFDEPVLQIHDPDIVKAVLVKDFQYFCDRSLSANEAVDPLPAKGLFGLKGERWKKSRNALTPSFTSGKMKRMYELIAECGTMLVSTLKHETGKPVAVYEIAARYTTDIIASCAFGIQGNTLADPDAVFRRKLRLAFEFSPLQAIAMAASFLSPKLVQLTGLKVMNAEVDEFVRSSILTTMKHRQSENVKRNDLLNSLIELKNAGRISEGDDKTTSHSTPTLTLDDEDICAHSLAFLTAGFETSATTISYALYELALHGDAQEKLRREVQQAPADKNGILSYDTLHSLKYLDMVLSETLRKYPPLPFLDRISNKPYQVPGTQLTLGTDSRVIIPVYGFQMDPKYYPNPKHFDPERFSEENKKSHVKYTYMPFGDGPRNCAGVRFALMQTKGAIAHIINNYSVHPCSATPKEIEFSAKTFLLQPKQNFEIVFKEL